MPAIYLFERRTFLGGDDLQPALFLALLLRLVQLTLFLGPLLAHIVHESQVQQHGFLAYVLFDSNPHNDACRHSHLFGLLLLCYAVASAVHSLGSAMLEYRLSQWASVGAPTDTQPRAQKVSYLLELKLLPCNMVLFLVFGTGIAMLALAPRYYACQEDDQDDDEESVHYYYFYSGSSNEDVQQNTRHVVEDWKLWWVATGFLLLTQLSEVVVSCLYLLHLCAEPPRRQNDVFASGSSSYSTLDLEGAASNDRHHELVEQMWAERCASMCQCLGVASCWMFGGREVLGGQGDFGDVARALADYLETRGVLDLVPSDIAAGFLVLQRLQKWRVQKSRQALLQQQARHNAAEQQHRTNSILIPAARHETGEGILMADDDLHVGPPRPSDGSSSYSGSSHSSHGEGDEGLLLTARHPYVDEGGSRKSLYRYTSDGSYERRTRQILSRHNVQDCLALEEGARYAKYALAIYTWVLYLYVRPVTGLPRLAAMGSLACCRRRQRRRRHKQRLANQRTQNRSIPSNENNEQDEDDGDDDLWLSDTFMDDYHDGRIEGDNLCESHKTALLLTAGLKESDLVYLQLKSGFRHNPYCILLDHEWQSVVVSIRGTFSLEDCVTDVLIEPESLEPLGQEFGFDATNQYCHGGVLLFVRNIYRDLQRHQWLDTLLLGDDARYPHYTLRLVGHSLGAAACTILSYMLKPRFPTLRCVNYSPACTVTWELATVGCQEWCHSFVLDSDIVPRLSFDSMEQWRDEILHLIGRIKVPKVEVVRRFFKQNRRNGGNWCYDAPLASAEEVDDDDEDTMSQVLYEPDQVPDTDYKRQLERFWHIQEERRRRRGERRASKLYPPGKLLHLVKTDERRACVHGLVKCLTCCTTNVGFLYTPVWIQNDDLNEIVISPTMGTDHFPNRMLNVVNAVAAEYGISGNNHNGHTTTTNNNNSATEAMAR